MGNLLKKFRNSIIACAIVLAQTVTMVAPITVHADTRGFYVNGSKLYDANGNEFVMRGINHAHAWYKGNESVAIPAIAKTGSNTVRVALSNGGQWGYDDVNTVKNIINIAKANNLVTVLEVHDATGMDSQYELDRIVNYWIDIKDALIGNEDTVIVNIANEWYGSWDSRGWADGYINAIPKLRAAGINNTLMVDCAGWGQYPKSVHDYGKEVFNADPNKNTMFSIHMYEYAGGDYSTVRNNIDGVINQGLALTIGEFGFKHTDGDVDEDTIMNYSQEKGVGYLGWSWYGNGDVWKYLDISYDWSGNNLTEWGNTLLYHQNGIKNTSKICSVFTDDGNNGGNNNGNEGDNNNGGSGNGTYLTAEAESGYLNGVYESTWRGGYSGNGYVTGFQDWNNSVEVTFNVPTSGRYHINVQYASEYGDKYTSLYVNGYSCGDKLLNQSNSFTDAYLDTIYLNAGENTVRLQSNWGYYDIDVFSLTRE